MYCNNELVAVIYVPSNDPVSTDGERCITRGTYMLKSACLYIYVKVDGAMHEVFQNVLICNSVDLVF